VVVVQLADSATGLVAHAHVHFHPAVDSGATVAGFAKLGAVAGSYGAVVGEVD
jgi:hypothetical protein